MNSGIFSDTWVQNCACARGKILAAFTVVHAALHLSTSIETHEHVNIYSCGKK